MSIDRLTLSIPEACDATGLGRSTLYEEIRAGRLATIKVGARRLVRVRDLERFIDSHVEELS